MPYRFLDGTSLEVSQVCLGTMTFGDQVKEREAFEIMDQAFDKFNVNMFVSCYLSEQTIYCTS